MDLTKLYSKKLGKDIRKIKQGAIITLLIGCATGPFCEGLAAFIVGCAIGVHALISGLEKNIKKNIFLASRTELKGDNICIQIEDKNFEVLIKENSDALKKSEFEGEDILVFNPGIIICQVEQDEQVRQ